MNFHQEPHSIEYHLHQLQNQRSSCSPLCVKSNVKQQSCGAISNKAILRMHVCMYVCMHGQPMNHIFLKKGLDLMQRHLLHSFHAVQAVSSCSVYATGCM